MATAPVRSKRIPRLIPCSFVVSRSFRSKVNPLELAWSDDRPARVSNATKGESVPRGHAVAGPLASEARGPRLGASPRSSSLRNWKCRQSKVLVYRPCRRRA